MDSENLNKTQDEGREACLMDTETVSLVGELSRTASLSSMTEDAPTPASGAKVKRKRKVSPKKKKDEDTEQEDDSSADQTMEHLRKQRTDLEAFLFNETNKINKSSVKYILNKWSILEGKVQDLIIQNKILESKLTHVESATVPSPSKSYAQVAAGGVRLRPSGSGMAAPERRKRDQSKSNEVILIKPTNEEDTRSVDELRKSLTDQLETVRGKLKIRNIRQTRQKGLLIEVNSKQDINMIRNGSLDKVGLKTEEPKRLNPSLIIFDVEKEQQPEDLKRDFINKNFEFGSEDEKKKMEDIVNFKYKFLNKAGRHNWVIQVPGKKFLELMNQDRVFMCWRAYRFSEYVNITRCYKCHGFGHIAKYCNAPDQLCEMCGSKEHAKANCPEKDTPKCINCKRMRRGNQDHWVKGKSCPEYLRQVEIYNRKIEWG